MLRVIVRTDDANMAAHVGGNVLTTHTTFHISDTALEAFLRDQGNGYIQRQVIGVEIMEEPKL